MIKVDLMTNLSDLGFSKDTIAETILSTYNPDMEPNAAPMGVIMQSDQQLAINLFNSSQTSRNLQTNRFAVLNLTGNIEIFYKAAFKETNPCGRLPQEWFEKAQVVDAPKLRMADAVIEVSVKELVPLSEQKTQAVFNVELVAANQWYPQVYCRAFSATLEAIIHATRVKALISDEKEQETVSKLLATIESSSDVVNRVAPNSSYTKIMVDLTRRIDSWRNTP